jgi:hypothetical protein
MKDKRLILLEKCRKVARHIARNSPSEKFEHWLEEMCQYIKNEARLQKGQDAVGLEEWDRYVRDMSLSQ